MFCDGTVAGTGDGGPPGCPGCRTAGAGAVTVAPGSRVGSFVGVVGAKYPEGPAGPEHPATNRTQSAMIVRRYVPLMVAVYGYGDVHIGFHKCSGT